MSAIETIETALLAKVVARIATATTRRGAIFVDDIPATSLPFAFTASPTVASEAVDFEQRVRKTAISIVIAWHRSPDSSGAGATRASALDDMEAIETAIEETDPTLAGTVQAARVDGFFLDENPESSFFVGVMAIIIEERR